MKIVLFQGFVRGMHYRGPAARLAASKMVVGAELKLDLEPNNPADVHAIKLLSGDVHLGYVPRGPNEPIAALMEVLGLGSLSGVNGVTSNGLVASVKCEVLSTCYGDGDTVAEVGGKHVLVPAHPMLKVQISLCT